MATIKVMLNPYADKDGLSLIFVRVEHKGIRRKIPVDKVAKKFWTGSQVSGKHPKALLINSTIASKEAEIKRYLADCQLHGKPVHLDLIGTGRASYSFTDYLRNRSKVYRAAGKIIMSKKVDRFVLELIECAGREVYFEEVTVDFLRKLEQKQIDNGNVENTRHKKFKFLGEFYGHAMIEGKAPAPNHFKAYKIAQKPVKKDKLTDAQIAAIESLQVAGPVADARNLFLFSFYTKGQRFETCVTLRRNQVRNGRVYFRTNKGNSYLSVKIHDRLQAILSLYPDGEMIFPFVKTIPADPEEYISVIGTQNTMVNKYLKVVATLAEIDTKLTFHIARHTFAYQLKKVTDNINVIQDSLGHSDQRTTQIYLKALEDDRLDAEMEKLYGV